jgi:hypothetical protein
MPASVDSSQKLNHDAIAMARFFSGLLEALARLSRQEPTPEYFIAFQEEIHAEKNDRGAAILLACNVEICLRFAIDRNLTLGIDAYKDLFHTGGPLRSFEAKIRVGYSMGLFRDQTNIISIASKEFGMPSPTPSPPSHLQQQRSKRFVIR